MTIHIVVVENRHVVRVYQPYLSSGARGPRGARRGPGRSWEGAQKRKRKKKERKEEKRKKEKKKKRNKKRGEKEKKKEKEKKERIKEKKKEKKEVKEERFLKKIRQIVV